MILFCNHKGFRDHVTAVSSEMLLFFAIARAVLSNPVMTFK